MTTVDISIRDLLSKDAQRLFDDIVSQSVLGASTHIRMITKMIQDLCISSQEKNSSTKTVIKDIHKIADFFIRTRGEASQAITNALNLIIDGIDDFRNNDLNTLINHINKKIELFEQNNLLNLDKINTYVLGLLNNMRSILVFDYSSTVGTILASPNQNGKILEIYIPESRALDGGRPYIEKCLNGKHKVHFIPDVAIYHYIKRCDGVFIGSETYYADGRVFNTVGSEFVAFLCNKFNIPFYVITTLVKIDMRSLYGYVKPQVILDLKDRIGKRFEPEIKKLIDFSCPELVEIPSEYISAFITEKGIIPPSAIFQISNEYVRSIGMK